MAARSCDTVPRYDNIEILVFFQEMSEANRPKKAADAKKAELRASLPDLLTRAADSAEAAQVALRACSVLRRKPPTVLLTQENIVRALSALEISKSLSLLFRSKDYVDVSPALTALRISGSHGHVPIDIKSIIQISKAVTSNISKIVGETVKSKKSSKQVKEKAEVVFTESTVADASGVVLWIMSRMFESQASTRTPVLPLGMRLVHALELMWRHSEQSKTAGIAVVFFHSLRRAVTKSAYSDLEDDNEIAAFIRDANAALLDWSRFALLEGRLKDVQTALQLAKGEERSKILSELQSICRTSPSQVLPQLIEWTAQQVQADKPLPKSLTAADESQSSDLDYVTVSLLSAWDSATDGARSARTLASIQKLARELFNVEFVNSPGEVIPYDERRHEVTESGYAASADVEVVRPGIQWSDGTRTRFLVRAVVRPKT